VEKLTRVPHVVRLHCNIELEQDNLKASVLNEANLCRIPGPKPDPNLDLEADSDPTPYTTDSNQLSLADLLAYCATDVHTAHKVYSTTFLSRCPHPVSFWGVLAMGSGLGILKAPSVFIEGWQRE